MNHIKYGHSNYYFHTYSMISFWTMSARATTSTWRHRN